MPRMGGKDALNNAAAGAMIVASVAMVWSIAFPSPERSAKAEPLSESLPTEPLTIGSAPLLGSPEARAVLIEYADFQCPACGKFAKEVYPGLVERYVKTGKLKLMFRHLPLSIHDMAPGASAAAVCAQQQGLFWEMYEGLFKIQATLAPQKIQELAVSLGADKAKLAACMEVAGPTAVKQDLAEATRLGFRSTPTFVLGSIDGADTITAKVVLKGMPSPDRFVRALAVVVK